MNINFHDYWKDIDSRLDELVLNGVVKLPSLKAINLNQVADKIIEEMGADTFKELSTSHQKFLENLGVADYLTPKLYKIAKDIYGYKGNIDNQYHVSRKVEPGNSKEMYRAHFDSHLFTMVLPLKIPHASDTGSAGELIYFSNARSRPGNEISNFLSKLYHKRYASKEGLDLFSSKYKKEIENFYNLEPLLFLGNTTLHTNKPVTHDCSSTRLTCLAHFFDPSPKYGIGSLLRMLRRR